MGCHPRHQIPFKDPTFARPFWISYLSYKWAAHCYAAGGPCWKSFYHLVMAILFSPSPYQDWVYFSLDCHSKYIHLLYESRHLLRNVVAKYGPIVWPFGLIASFCPSNIYLLLIFVSPLFLHITIVPILFQGSNHIYGPFASTVVLDSSCFTSLFAHCYAFMSIFLQFHIPNGSHMKLY